MSDGGGAWGGHVTPLAEGGSRKQPEGSGGGGGAMGAVLGVCSLASWVSGSGAAHPRSLPISFRPLTRTLWRRGPRGEGGLRGGSGGRRSRPVRDRGPRRGQLTHRAVGQREPGSCCVAPRQTRGRSEPRTERDPAPSGAVSEQLRARRWAVLVPCGCAADVSSQAAISAFLFLQIPCLCGGASCLLCRCCPNSKNSTVTRLIYALLLLLSTAVACIMLAPGMEEQLKKVWRRKYVYCQHIQSLCKWLLIGFTWN